MEETKNLIQEMVMTKSRIAEEAGVSRTLLNRFENGEYPGYSLQEKIKAAAKKHGEKLIKLANADKTAAA